MRERLSPERREAALALLREDMLQDRPPAPPPDPARVAETLSRHGYNVTSEAELQEAVGRALREDWVTVEREVPLGRTDRPDFMVSGTVVVECKVDGSSNDVIRQLHRYAGYDRVTGIVLVTTRRRHVVPAELSGRPVAVLVVGGIL